MSIPAEQRSILISHRLDSAREALDDARVLRGRQSLRGAANRIYYAMFHAVSALALDRQVSYKTHSGLIAFFQRDFVKAGVFDRSHGRALQKAFEDRSDADYDDIINISEEQIDRRLDEAVRFVDAIALSLADTPPQ